MSELKKEFKSYYEDLEKNIKNKEDLAYIKERTAEFMNIIIGQMENILNYKEEKISQIEKVQEDLSEKIASIQQDIAEIEEDIYMEDEDIIYDEEDDENDNNYDLEIICPYCDNEFAIDLNQENQEIECPKCNNIIELDWSGNSDDEDKIENNTGCNGGHCSRCSGCNSIEKDEDEDM